MVRKRKSSLLGSMGSELFRAACVLGLSAALGLVVNAFSAQPVPIRVNNPPPDDPGLTTESTAKGAANTPANPSEMGAVGRVSLKQLMEKWQESPQSVRVVDVRNEAAFKAGHIPGSINIPNETLQSSRRQFDGQLQGATLIAVLCDSDQCPKSEEAAKTLTQFGYKNVRVLAGGWEGYKYSGYTVEK